VLPQSGNIFVAGGDNWTGSATTNTGNNNTNVFTTASNSLARGNNLNRPRWYSSSITLLNGEIYIQGGTGGSDRPEIRDVNGGLRLLSNANTGSYSATYPRNFLAPGWPRVRLRRQRQDVLRVTGWRGPAGHDGSVAGRHELDLPARSCSSRAASCRWAAPRAPR
jgi:hypothetical protein